MVKMGYVLGNLMVNLQLKSEKLLDRARRIVAEVAGCDRDTAAQALAASGNRARVAIVMAKFGVDRAAAERRIAEANDDLWGVLGSAGPAL